MSLKTILDAKGGNIACVEPTADLAAAAKLLSTHHIGALVVVDEHFEWFRGSGDSLDALLCGVHHHRVTVWVSHTHGRQKRTRLR
jgi:CBS domain-containing protein